MGFYSVVAFFQKGGLFMYPILIVFAGGMAIAFERWVQLKRIRIANHKMWNVLQPVLVKGEFDKARQIVNKDKSNMAQMLAMGLARQGAVRRREDVEIAIPQLETRTPYVALLSNIATLLGLLGTIMGLIAAFTAVANANPAEKADLLSASISVAMNTTAFHRIWSDVRHSASAPPCQANLDHRPDRGQPGDGICQGAEYYLQFRQAPL
jgi:biopolymer transport protein ExbB